MPLVTTARLLLLVILFLRTASAQIYIQPEDVAFIDTPTVDYDSANAECRSRLVPDIVPTESMVLGGVRYSAEYSQLLAIVSAHINANTASYASILNAGATTVSFLMAGTDVQLYNTWRWIGGRYNTTVFYSSANGCVVGFYCNWQPSYPILNSWQHCMAMEGPRPADLDSTVTWTATNAKWHNVACNDTQVPAMCRAFRCVLELDCVLTGTIVVRGYYPSCKCMCKGGRRGARCQSVATATAILTATLSGHSTLTVTSTFTSSRSSSSSHSSTKTQIQTQSGIVTRTQTLTLTISASGNTRTKRPTSTSTASRSKLTTQSRSAVHTKTKLPKKTATMSRSHALTPTRSRPETRTRLLASTKTLRLRPTKTQSRTRPDTKTQRITNTKSLLLTITKRLTSTYSLSSTRHVLPTLTKEGTLMKPATRSATLSNTKRQVATKSRIDTKTQTPTRTEVAPRTKSPRITATISLSRSKPALVTKSFPITKTKALIQTRSQSKTRKMKATVSAPLTETQRLTITKRKPKTKSPRLSGTLTLSKTKQGIRTRSLPTTVTPSGSKTMIFKTRSMNPVQTTSVTLLPTKTITLPPPQTSRRLPTHTQLGTFTGTLRKTRTLLTSKSVSDSRTGRRTRSRPLLDTDSNTVSKSERITHTRVIPRTASMLVTVSASITTSRNGMHTLSDLITPSLVIVTPERSENSESHAAKPSATLLRSTTKSVHTLRPTPTKSSSFQVASTVSRQLSNTVGRVRTVSHNPAPTRSVSTSFHRAGTASEPPTITIEPHHTKDHSHTLTVTSTQSVSPSRHKDSKSLVLRTESKLPTLTAPITRTRPLPQTISQTASQSLSISDRLGDGILLQYLGAAPAEIAPALATLWVPGIVQCRATSNYSAASLLSGLDPRQVAARSRQWPSTQTQCYEYQCFPRPNAAPVCEEVAVQCDGYSDAETVDEIVLAKKLANQRAASSRELLMMVYRALSPFAMGTSPIWVIAGSALATSIALFVQAGLGTLLYRAVCGRYYSWLSSCAGVHGASIAISWSYTLAGGVGTALLHVYLMSSASPSPTSASVSPRANALWGWESAERSSQLQTQCDPIQALCEGLHSAKDADARLVASCIPCYDYYLSTRSVSGKAIFNNDPSMNTYIIESDWLGPVALVIGILFFLIGVPVASFLLVHLYATPRRYFGVPYESDARDGLPSFCCCCRPFLFFLRGVLLPNLSHTSVEEYDQLDDAAEDRRNMKRTNGPSQTAGTNGEAEIDLGSDEDDEGTAPRNKFYGLWPLYWPFGESSRHPKSRKYFPRPYYVGEQSDSDVEREEENAVQEKSKAFVEDYGSNQGRLAFLKAGSPFRTSWARSGRRHSRRFLRTISCRGFVGPIHVRRLWGVAVSRYRLPSAVWSTMPLWSGLIVELACLAVSPLASSQLDGVFDASTISNVLGCSMVLYLAAIAHFMLAAWLYCGFWKQPLRSPFLNWCTAVAWTITGLHLLFHGIVAKDISEFSVPEALTSEQFTSWDRSGLPQRLGNEMVSFIAQNSTELLTQMLENAALTLGSPLANSVTSDVVLGLSASLLYRILTSKGAPMYLYSYINQGAFMPPSSYYTPYQDVVDFAAATADATTLINLTSIVRNFANYSDELTDIASKDAPLYVDNYFLLSRRGSPIENAELSNDSGTLYYLASDEFGNGGYTDDIATFGDLFNTLQGHILLNTMFLVMHTMVMGVRIASAFLFLVSDTFLVVTASGAIKRKRNAKAKGNVGKHIEDVPAAGDGKVTPKEQDPVDYHYYYFKDESLMMPLPNDDVSARAMDNEEVFAEMGWAVASGVEAACVTMYDVYRQRFGLTTADQIDDEDALTSLIPGKKKNKSRSSSTISEGMSGLIRFRVAKARGLIPPVAHWEVISQGRSVCPCIKDDEDQESEPKPKPPPKPTQGAARRRGQSSAAFLNLQEEGFGDEGFGDLQLLDNEMTDTKEDSKWDFAQTRKRAASKMYIAKAAERQRGKSQIAPPLGGRSRSQTIALSKGGTMRAIGHGVLAADARAADTIDQNDDDDLDKEIMKLLQKKNEGPNTAQEGQDDAIVNVTDGSRPDARSRAFTRRFSMFSPGDELMAKNAVSRKSARHQSLFDNGEKAHADAPEAPVREVRPAPAPTPPVAKRSTKARELSRPPVEGTAHDEPPKPTPVVAPKPKPKPKIRSRTKSEFVREVANDDNL